MNTLRERGWKVDILVLLVLLAAQIACDDGSGGVDNACTTYSMNCSGGDEAACQDYTNNCTEK